MGKVNNNALGAAAVGGAVTGTGATIGLCFTKVTFGVGLLWVLGAQVAGGAICYGAGLAVGALASKPEQKGK